MTVLIVQINNSATFQLQAAVKIRQLENVESDLKFAPKFMLQYVAVILKPTVINVQQAELESL
jgi:hypothetical protein